MESEKTNGRITRGARFGAAVLFGYATMFLLIFAAQDGLFGGVSYGITPLPQLLVAGALTNVAAIVGGAVAALIFGRPWFPPVAFVCGLVVLETSYMILAGRLDGPVWFDVLAGTSLLVGLLFGAYCIMRLQCASNRKLERDLPAFETGR